MIQLIRYLGLGFALVVSSVSSGGRGEAETPKPPVRQAPESLSFYSGLESEEQRRSYLDEIAKARAALLAHPPTHPLSPADTRRAFDNAMRPGLDRLRNTFAVDIEETAVGGIRTYVVTPAAGVPSAHRQHVLINLHGGAFYLGAGYLAQIESIPIAALGHYKVVSVDYRLGPENHFPAASEDVTRVYRELLKSYRPEDIGVYGCSAGGVLTTEAVAWFQSEHLPRPGAIGVFGAGALIEPHGISAQETDARFNAKKDMPYFDVAGLDTRGPLVAPVFSQAVLEQFPPTLIVTGTRDPNLSPAAFTHAALVQAGVPTDLHVFEGAVHCAFAGRTADNAIPETREAWRVIIDFFDRHLGK